MLQFIIWMKPEVSSWNLKRQFLHTPIPRIDIQLESLEWNLIDKIFSNKTFLKSGIINQL